jgi:hypothetical protein
METCILVSSMSRLPFPTILFDAQLGLGIALRYSGTMKFVAITLAAVTLYASAPARGSAQTAAPTLMAPQAQSKTSRPVAPAKPTRAGRANPCSVYGEGFAYVPGSGTCVKVGGYVRSETAVRLSR